MIYFADDNWTPEQANPFSPDGAYGVQWSAFRYDETLAVPVNRNPDARVYTIAMPPQLDPDFDRIRDFIQYETFYERHSIVQAGTSRLMPVQEALMMLHPKKGVKMRENDPTVLVYSTVTTRWRQIQQEGKICAPSAGGDADPLEVKLAPNDYRDYIRLEILGETEPIDGDVRLYFDGKKLFENGMIMRDGFHPAKVYHSLLLAPYLIGTITADEMAYTSGSFAMNADRYFLEKYR